MESKKFMISDGTYCHILDDKIIFGEPASIINIPEMDHKNRRPVTLISATALLALAGLFTYGYLIEQVITELWITVMALVFIGLFRTWIFRDTSSTPCIEKK